MRPRTPSSRLTVRDLVAEGTAGLVQRPGRSALTALGTLIGVGAFVAILGLTATAQGQIGASFDALRNTTVTVADVGPGAGEAPAAGEAPVIDFPPDADRRVLRLDGVVSAGVYWRVPTSTLVVAGRPTFDSSNASGTTLYAASAGVFDAVRARVAAGVVFDRFHDDRGEPVAVLGAAAAEQLGVTQLSGQPAVFVNGRAYTVVGIVGDVVRLPELLNSVIIPRGAAEDVYGPPDPATNPAQMLIETRVGAAQVVASQVPVALRPDRAEAFMVSVPPDPRSLRDRVDTELSTLFLLLAGLSLVVGGVGIANTTLVAILERVPEIGLRRSLGARPVHIAAQFLAETTALGTLGGLLGTSVGVAVVVLTAAARDWTAILDPALVVPAPLIGSVVGLVAGIYPALRAASIEPLEALRRG